MRIGARFFLTGWGSRTDIVHAPRFEEVLLPQSPQEFVHDLCLIMSDRRNTSITCTALDATYGEKQSESPLSGGCFGALIAVGERLLVRTTAEMSCFRAGPASTHAFELHTK